MSDQTQLDMVIRHDIFVSPLIKCNFLWLIIFFIPSEVGALSLGIAGRTNWPLLTKVTLTFSHFNNKIFKKKVKGTIPCKL
jgi:hypothetical protein